MLVLARIQADLTHNEKKTCVWETLIFTTYDTDVETVLRFSHGRNLERWSTLKTKKTWL